MVSVSVSALPSKKVWGSNLVSGLSVQSLQVLLVYRALQFAPECPGELSVWFKVWMVVWLSVSTVIGGWPIQRVPILSPPDSWHRLQQTPATPVWIKQVQKMNAWVGNGGKGQMVQKLDQMIRTANVKKLSNFWKFPNQTWCTVLFPHIQKLSRAACAQMVLEFQSRAT